MEWRSNTSSLADEGATLSTEAIPTETERDRVIETVARFHRAVDYANWDLFRSVVTDDVAWWISISDGSSSLVHDFSGADNIVEYLRLVAPGATPHHHTTNHLVEIGETTASYQAYMLAMNRMTLTPLAEAMVGCELVRSGSGWLIARFSITEHVQRGSVSYIESLLEDWTSPTEGCA
jgi:hypothetical protein